MPDLSPDIERELEALDDALAGRRVPSDLTELGELALLLREDRPQPEDGFGRDLDRRMRLGFPKRDPSARASGRRWFAWQGWMAPALGAAATVMLVAVLVVAGPNGSDDSEDGGGGDASVAMESSGGGNGGGATAAEDSARSSSSESDSSGGAEPQSALAPGSVPPAPDQGSPGSDGRDNRRVERSASLTLATRPRDIDAVSKRIQEVTSAQGGFVVSSTVRSSRHGGGGEYELRIPTRNLDAAMAELSRLGNVRSRAQSSRDITAQAVSARSRLKDARTERKSLLRQLADAVTLTQTESIRARLKLVGREIERARAQVRRVNNRASFSTVDVTLESDRSAGAPSSDDGWSPADAARDALRVLEVAAGVALIALAIVLPLALVATPAVLAARWTRRRRREQALDAV